MKKAIAILLSVLMIMVVFTACGEKETFPQDVSCEDIMKAAQSVGEVPEAQNIYLKSQENLDSCSMSLWVDGIFEESKELDKLKDYAIFLSAGVTTYEIAVLKAQSEKDIDVLKDIINRRKQTLTLGDKGMYDPDFDVRMENAEVYNDGMFVIFLVTEDNAASKNAIENLKK